MSESSPEGLVPGLALADPHSNKGATSGTVTVFVFESPRLVSQKPVRCPYVPQII